MIKSLNRQINVIKFIIINILIVLQISCEFHSYTTVKIIVELRKNMYFKGVFQCKLTVKFTGNLFSSEIHSYFTENV